MNPGLRMALLAAGALAGYAILMGANPVKDSLRDGWRALRRYPALWGALALFGVCYAAFHQVGVRLLDLYFLPESGRAALEWTRGWTLTDALRLEAARRAVLPALENTAGLFNNLIATFPFSVAAAVLLLFNWKGHHTVLNAALRRRYGARGWALDALISTAALATLAKPFVLYAGLPVLARSLPGKLLLPPSLAVDWLAFLFEYLFGVCIQIYLILIVHSWVRGASFEPAPLLDFAIRRFSAVMKWAAVVLALSSALIYLPLLASTLPPFSARGGLPEAIAYVDHVARPALALLLIFFASVQITLVFHSESLREALRHHLRFLRDRGTDFAWFLAIAAVHFYGFHFLENALMLGLGDATVAGFAWQLAAPLLKAFLAAWLLASWVCLFRKAEPDRPHDSHSIAF